MLARFQSLYLTPAALCFPLTATLSCLSDHWGLSSLLTETHWDSNVFCLTSVSQTKVLWEHLPHFQGLSLLSHRQSKKQAQLCKPCVRRRYLRRWGLGPQGASLPPLLSCRHQAKLGSCLEHAHTTVNATMSKCPPQKGQSSLQVSVQGRQFPYAVALRYAPGQPRCLPSKGTPTDPEPWELNYTDLTGL